MSAPEPAPAQAPPQPVPETGDAAVGEQAVAATVGFIEDSGAYILPLGAGVELAASVLGDGRQADIPLAKIPNIPGLDISEAKFNRSSTRAMVTLKGKTRVPMTEATDVTLAFGRDGRPDRFAARTKLALDWLGRPDLSFEWDPGGSLSASVTVTADKFIPEAARRAAQATGDLSLTLQDGQLTGAVNTDVVIPDLMDAKFEGAFGGDGPAATVTLTNKAEWLGELTGEGSVDAEGNLSARIEKGAGEFATPVPGLSFLGGTISVSLNNDGSISGGLTDLHMKYGTLAEARASFMIEGKAYTGSADLELTVPGLNEAKGSIRMEDGKLSGAFSLGKENFPEGLPLEAGTIEGTISAAGAMAFSGSVGVTLGPLGKGELKAKYGEDGAFSIGASVDVIIPGLETAKIEITYDAQKGDISGEAQLGVDPALLDGIEGNVTVTYAEGRWSGETKVGYEADNGKLKGELTIRVRQAEDDSLKMSGDGQVTVQIMPKLQGTLTANVLEEGGIDISGEILVTEPLEMFPEYRIEKELLDISTKIPLWAILVAVLRVRAGVRAGVGPGVFRDIKVTGSYSIGKEGEPSFTISGEMFIPAFVEGYVGFGAGLGASVVLGSLTGGIEAMGTAGIYGAISVIPELAYKDGDYSIEGVATMAAGARLKLSLNAWAEIEAFWVTVWDNTWELASVTMPIGPDLAMQAKMAYTFGNPAPPTLDFSTSDIDSDALIADAMPKDGPPKAGVKDAVKNEAKWQGAQRAKGKEADTVPPDLARQGESAPPVSKPESGQPPAGPGAPPAGADGKPLQSDPTRGEQPTDETGQPKDPNAAEQQAKDAATPDPNASGTVADADAASTETPRHKQVSLRMLSEPPVPMPRTKAQQAEDVAAAARLVRLVAESGETTDSLDNYFPQIKARFQLSKIGFVVDGGGLAVEVKVNSEDKVHIGKEEVQNLSHAVIGSSKALATTVRYDTKNKTFKAEDIEVTQSDLGVKMVADPLTPLHAQGSGPKGSALGSVFRVLATQGPTGSEGYIKGHLLNDNLGGPGEDRNLFPITQIANTRHHEAIEKTAKDLVNNKHYFVRYTVEMIETGNPEAYDDVNGERKLAINANIKATLEVLNADLTSARHVKTANIPSIFTKPPKVETDGTSDEDIAKARELLNATKAELQDPVAKGKTFSKAEGQAELDRRANVSKAFEDDAANKVEEDADKKLLAKLNAGTDTEAGKQDGVVQDEVALSSARRETEQKIELDGAVISALRKLSALRGNAVPYSGAAELRKRLSDASIGTSNVDGLLAAAGPGVAAAAVNTDIAKSSLDADRKAVLKQVNSAGSAANIEKVVAIFLKEGEAGALVSASPSEADIETIADKLNEAKALGGRTAEQDALAKLIVDKLGGPAKARAYLRDLGIYDSKGWFHTKLRTQANKSG